MSYENLVRLTCNRIVSDDDKECGIASLASAIDDLVDEGWHYWITHDEHVPHHVACPSCALYYKDATRELRSMRRSGAIEVNAEAACDQEGAAYIFLVPDPDCWEGWVGIHRHGEFGETQFNVSWEGLVELTSAMARLIETHRPEDFKRLRGVG